MTATCSETWKYKWSHKMEMPLVTIATHAVLPCSLPLSIEPGDYDPVNTTIIFLVGTARGDTGSQMCIPIEISSLDGLEMNETFLLSADSPDPNVNIMNTATVTIINSDGR